VAAGAGAAMGAAAQPLILRRTDILLKGEKTIQRMLETPH
jgi:hypothetical protein